MKQLLLLSTLFVLLTTACNQPKTTTLATVTNNNPFNLDFDGGKKAANRLYPDKLRGLPNEIKAAHYPNPVFATFEDSMYVWKHNITLQTTEDLQLVEYGSFVYTDSGWYLRVTMSPKEFEESFNCKNGLLKKGVIYTDKNDWRRGKKLSAGDAMWYFIAKDKLGRLVKGMAPIETEGKLITQTPIKTIAAIKQSTINWTGYGEVGGYSLTGTLPLKSSTIEVDSNRVSYANFDFDIKNLTHENEQLVTHLKGADFFDVDRFPKANFVTENIVYKDANNAVLNGKLTIKGITKAITFTIKQQQQNNGLQLTGTVKVDRTAFGIKYNSSSFFGNLGDQAIKNDFDISFELKVVYN